MEHNYVPSLTYNITSKTRTRTTKIALVSAICVTAVIALVWISTFRIHPVSSSAATAIKPLLLLKEGFVGMLHTSGSGLANIKAGFDQQSQLIVPGN